jgi:hypothetical protein
MSEPLEKAPTLDHVRRPDLPWRQALLTECGKPIAEMAQTISRDELIARLRSWGKARTSMSTCMTCWQTAARWKTFAEDPVDALRREVHTFRRSEVEAALAADLRALAALAQAHRDEFEGYLAGLAETASLRSAWRENTRRSRLTGTLPYVESPASRRA